MPHAGRLAGGRGCDLVVASRSICGGVGGLLIVDAAGRCVRRFYPMLGASQSARDDCPCGQDKTWLLAIKFQCDCS